MYAERMKVIDNIRAALLDGDCFRRVEMSDGKPNVGKDERNLIPFDIERKKLSSKLLAFFARRVAEGEMKKRSSETKIVGLENARSVEGGAIITQNHFNDMDSTMSRLLATKCGRRKKFDIVIDEERVFSRGYHGFLMRNANTLPTSNSDEYMESRFFPTAESLLSDSHFILAYPEDEMWFNYKKPRKTKSEAYRIAAKLGVPIIPTFVTMEADESELDEDGFFKILHTIHVMPPIYPDPQKSIDENSEMMQAEDYAAKVRCYEAAYKITLDESFIEKRDIAGFVV